VRDWGRLLNRTLPHAALACVVIALSAAGFLAPLSRSLIDWRFSAAPRNASGEIVIIAIDAKSIEAFRTWPWPRRIHADMIDRLLEAKVSEIVFDVDFSAPSTPADDQALEDALKRASGSVVLPAFRQHLSSDSGEDVLHVNRPLARFGSHAWPAFINVRPDPNGQIRHFTYGDTLDGEYVPSVAALLGGTVDRIRGEFLIDHSIRPDTIPTFSYSEIINGTIAADALAGKKVVVGSTAIELGDRYAVPVHGVIPGPVIQVVAAESILQGRALHATGIAIALGGLLAIWASTTLLWRNRRMRWHVAGLVVTAVTIEGAALAVQALTPIAPDTAPLQAAILAYLALSLLREIDFRRLLALIARNQTENTQRVLDQVIRDSFDGIVVTDEHGNVVMASAAATAILGLAGDAEPAGRPAADILPAPLLAAGTLVAAEPLDDTMPRRAGEAEVARDDGGTMIIEYFVTPSRLKGDRLADGTVAPDTMVVTYTFRDVTAERAAEKSIREAADAAISANAAKTAFLANMSHELRTPLNAILGFSDIIRNQSFGPIGKDEYVEFAREIHASGDKLLEVLNDIIEVTRIETGEITLNSDEIEVDYVIESAFRAATTPEILRTRSTSTSITAGLPNLHADYSKAKGIVANLISNAVKFTAEGGRVDASAYLNDAGELVIAIADDGVGIPAGAIDKVTRAFFQADSALNRMHEGSGLGLTVASAHIQAHGGRLEIESEVGRGTIVRAVFPANRVVPPGTPSMDRPDCPQPLRAAAGT
jgi:PAS domain S-box-containing protein